ncbi:DUF3310 domain-containing protein [Proteus terrae]|uniref:DUF3310 domain-containing protein n=1 Tax=Proteus terrae TaxID=1574161 RepID=UPI0034D39AFD
MTDNVNNPPHYASGDIECIDAIKASMTKEAFLGYLKGNIQKYVWRYEKKINPVQDLKRHAGIWIGWLVRWRLKNDARRKVKAI